MKVGNHQKNASQMMEKACSTPFWNYSPDQGSKQEPRRLYTDIRKKVSTMVNAHLLHANLSQNYHTTCINFSAVVSVMDFITVLIKFTIQLLSSPNIYILYNGYKPAL